jgi:hypothetical protein
MFLSLVLRQNQCVGQAFGRTGSRTTISKVQIGPSKSEPNHQPNPLRPLLCAKPALMSESVNQPTAYCPGVCSVFIVQQRGN